MNAELVFIMSYISLTYSEYEINSPVLGDLIGPSNSLIEIGNSGITYNMMISIFT
jgi:hypothetical protein